MKNKKIIILMLLNLFAMACSSEPKNKNDEPKDKETPSHRGEFWRHRDFGHFGRR